MYGASRQPELCGLLNSLQPNSTSSQIQPIQTIKVGRKKLRPGVIPARAGGKRGAIRQRK